MMVRDRDTILATRWLRPFAHLFTHPSLWHLNRRSVRRGLAIGLFVAFILPLGQIVVGALVAVQMRANVPIMAAATFVSNPLTMPPIYFGAYKIGLILMSQSPAGATGQASTGFLSKMLDVSAPTAVGLLVFGLVSATLGYAVASLWWRAGVIGRWRERRAGR